MYLRAKTGEHRYNVDVVFFFSSQENTKKIPRRRASGLGINLGSLPVWRRGRHHFDRRSASLPRYYSAYLLLITADVLYYVAT